MGLLDKLGIIQREEYGAPEKYRKTSAPAEIDDITYADYDVDTKSVLSISDIYAKENLSDLSRSIFKVNEIKAVVPAELPTDVKKKTVFGMLSVSQIDASELLDDAERRKDILEMFKLVTNQAMKDSVSSDEAKIAELEAQIDILRQNINASKTNTEAQCKLIDEELAKIEDIVKFMG